MYQLKVRRRLLKSPWSWALEEQERQKQAQKHGIEVPTLQVGEMLIAGVHSESVVLTKLTGDVRLDLPTIGADDDLRQLQERAWEQAIRYAPFLVRPGLARQKFMVRYRRITSSSVNQLTGGSYGASLFLASVSRLIGIPVPIDLFTSVVLRPLPGDPAYRGHSDSFGPVDGLTVKLREVKRHAPRIQRILVHPDNLTEVKTFCREEGYTVTVIPVTTYAEAISCAWGDQLDVFPSDLSDSDLNTLMRRLQLLDQASGEHHPAEWAAAERTASRLQKSDRITQDLRPMIENFGRHQGRKVFLFEPQASGNAQDCAHYIQSCVDTNWPLLNELLHTSYLPLIEKPEMCQSPNLLGALGRALSALNRLDDAARVLDQAIAQFGYRQEVSRPLSERLRVAGLQSDLSTCRQLEQDYQGLIHPDDDAEGWLRLSLGRALILCGQESSALTPLSSPYTNAHCEQSRLRWRVRALLTLKQPIPPQIYQTLEAKRADSEGAVFYSLMRLDQAIAGHDAMQVNTALKGLRDLPTDHQAGNLDDLFEMADRHENPEVFIADHFPY